MNQSLLAAATVAIMATSLPAAAQFQKPEDAVRYRQGALNVLGNHFARIGAMVNNRVPFDAATVQANAEIVASLSKLPFVAFVEGSTANSKAKPEVWAERAKFDAAAAKMQEEVGKLNAAAKTGNVDQIRAAFGAAGQSCKACHDNFRSQ